MKLPVSPRARRRLGIAGLAVLALLCTGYVVYGGGRHGGPGTPSPAPVAPELVAARASRQAQALAAHPAPEGAAA